MYKGSSQSIPNFAGGMHTNCAVTELKTNEALDLNNVVLGYAGSYVRTRYGDAAFNASAMNSGANVQGLGYFKLDNGNDFLVSVCGNKVFSSGSGLSTTMTDITGALSITTGQNNLWTLFTFNNVHLGFGGVPTSPDAPFVWTGSSTASALGGTPPSAYGAFQANNRVFAFRTSANPSRISWSALGNQADWTGTGAGNTDVWTSDNDSITACAVMSDSTVLVFKQNSIHKMLISNLVSGAFPVFSLFDGIGCAGKHAVVVDEGLCYFITAQGKMRITDGSDIYDETDIPALGNIDDLWGATNSGRRAYITGKKIIGDDFAHIHWYVSSSNSQTTNNWRLIWDIKNKCWLRDKTGSSFNAITTTQLGIPYAGGYDGKIYKLNDSTTNADVSNSSAQISSYWTSGWIKQENMEKIKQPRKASISFVSQNSGTLQFSWGFDFSSPLYTTSISQQTSAAKWDQFLWDQGIWGEQSDLIRQVRMVGRGNVFQFKFANSDARMKINTIEFSGKSYGQKEFAAR